MTFLQEIQEQPKALTETGSFYENQEGKEMLQYVSKLWQSRRYSHIILTGMGSSYFIATATASLLNAYKIPAFALNAGELLHYQAPLITPQSLIVCISQSGESYEVIKLIEKLSPNITILSICNEKESSLVRQSHHTLLCKAGKEEKTSTKTFITCYQVAYLLAMKLCNKETDNNQWHKLSCTIKKIINGDTLWMPKALELIANTTYVQLIGRGPLFAAASQSALMFMEATHTPASALLGGEFRHGPLEMVKKNFIAILFAHSQSETYEQSLSLVKDILKYEGKVILITNSEPIFKNEYLCTITIPCASAELFAIPSIVPVQVLINAWATKQGITPGEFTHGAKVTSIE